MKNDMCSYINSMTNSNMQALEDILTSQYKKFKNLYRMINKYSEDISSVKYEFISPNSLDVVLVLNDVDIKAMIEDLQSIMKEKEYDGYIKKIDDNNLLISLVLEE